MSKIDENHRYRPYNRTNRRYEDDYKPQYKRTEKHHYRYPSNHDQRRYNDLPYRRSYKNDYRYQQQPVKSRSYSYFSTPPPPLMSTNILPPLPLMSAQRTVSPPPPPPPLPPAPSQSVVPHERESWIRSVKKTKTNESTEQKTQYLETMLRMPQQKSLLKSSRFDRMRFADDQLGNTLSATTTASNDNLDQSSFHLIDDINNHDEICTLEKILFDNEIQSTLDHSSNPQSVTESKLNTQQSCSGFLIDNCEEEEELPPFSPLPPPPLPEALIEQNDEDISQGRVMLVSELDAADAERKQELKRQKRLHRKLQKKKRETNAERQATTSTIPAEQEESLSDWVLEYDADQVSRLTDEVRRASIAMSNEDKTEKVNLILLKIKKQQEELKKLRQYVMAMLGDQEKAKASKPNRQTSNLTEDLLLALLNQPTQSGCWLCSGKMYAEVATQCDAESEQ